MVDGGYQQRDREDWEKQLGLCTIKIIIPDGTVYEMRDAAITIERQTDYYEHQTMGQMDQKIPLNSRIKLEAISSTVPDVPEQSKEAFSWNRIPLPRSEDVVAERVIRFRAGKK